VCRDCIADEQCAAAASTFCSSGTCVEQLANGLTCERDAQCTNDACAFEGVCCNVECGGTCDDGECVPLAVVLNFDPTDCVGNVASPVTVPNNKDIHTCVYGLPPGLATLGIANVGDLPCDSAAIGTYIPLLTADGWTYEPARRVWHGILPSTVFGPGLEFTSCWKNNNTGALLKLFVVIADP
jgi:hypothetical protein